MLGEGRASTPSLAWQRQGVDGTPSRAMTVRRGAFQYQNHHALVQLAPRHSHRTRGDADWWMAPKEIASAGPNSQSEEPRVAPIYITYLNRLDIEELKITDEEILTAIETSLATQGRGEAVIEPRMHLEPKVANGHFNVLRGALKAPIDLAGVKVVGDFVDNYKLGFPSELAVLLLLDPAMGAPKAILDASGITDMRTGAVTAIGAKYLARKDAKVLGHIGARGTAYWNVRLLNHLFDFDEIRIHSRRRESREEFAERLRQDLGKPVTVTEDWRSCVEGADIVVEASRLSEPQPLLLTEWIKPGALVVPYGTMSAVELSLTDIMSKLVVDDWGQCSGGKFGSLRAHVESGRLSEETLYAELGQIVAGLRPGREREDETILLWHRGLSLSDIALGHAMLEKGARLGIGQRLRFA
jgi:alanine dehydrogenase